MSTEDSVKVSPRQYQLYLLELAKKSNVIAVLQTGAGKTLIAVLLIRYILDSSRTHPPLPQQESHVVEDALQPITVMNTESIEPDASCLDRVDPQETKNQDPDKETPLQEPIKNHTFCVFLVPAVPLVIQQANYIKNNCNYRVAHLYGAMGVDQWSHVKWCSFISQSDVIVMTPQILVDALHSKHIHFTDIELIVFDECHHARKGHQYNQIMEYYRHFQGDKKPKIFGMSASPSMSKGDVGDSIKTLERNLESRAYTLPEEDVQEIEKFIPPPKEQVIFYDQGPLFDLPSLFSSFVECRGYAYPEVELILNECLDVSDEYGPWWGDRFLSMSMRHLNSLRAAQNRLLARQKLSKPQEEEEEEGKEGKEEENEKDDVVMMEASVEKTNDDDKALPSTEPSGDEQSSTSVSAGETNDKDILEQDQDIEMTNPTDLDKEPMMDDIAENDDKEAMMEENGDKELTVDDIADNYASLEFPAEKDQIDEEDVLDIAGVYTEAADVAKSLDGRTAPLLEVFISELREKIGSERLQAMLPGRNRKRKRPNQEEEDASNSLHQIPIIKKDEISPKLQKLFDLLETYSEYPNFCGIVFVEKRSSAHILTQAIRHYEPLKFLKPGVLVGHGSANSSKRFGGSRMMAKEQERVVGQFRRGNINLLIATRIGEEGLDIQPCMLVVRLTMFQTLINYVQSRGRARHPASRYVLLMDESSHGEYELYEKVRDQEERMKTILKERSKEEEEEELESNYLLKPEEMYTSPVTGARVDILTAMHVLYRYCTLLPKDQYCVSKPEFSLESQGGLHVARVQLPISVPLECRLIDGPPSQGKKMAKKYAAFAAVKKLHEMGELDHMFRPVHLQLDQDGKVKPEVVSMLSTSVRRCRMGIASTLQGSWEDQNVFYLSYLRITRWKKEDGLTADQAKLPTELTDKSFIVGIVTIKRPQEDQDMLRIVLPFQEQNVDLCVEFESDKKPIELDVKTLEKIRKFHCTIYSAFLRKDMVWSDDWAYLMTPVVWKENKTSVSVDIDSLDQFYNEFEPFTHLFPLKEFQAVHQKHLEEIAEALKKQDATADVAAIESDDEDAGKVQQTDAETKTVDQVKEGKFVDDDD